VSATYVIWPPTPQTPRDSLMGGTGADRMKKGSRMAHRQVTIIGSLRRAANARAPRVGGLLMTATLSPPAGAVARVDPAARLEDYLEALQFYLTLPSQVIDRILFVDNSDGDLAPLAAHACDTAHDKIVELITFAGNDHSPALGKAYGEFRLMDYGLTHTMLFAPEDIIWKITGRLKFLNLPEVAGAARRPYDLLCDLHNLPFVGSGDWRDNRYLDLRSFAFRRHAYDAVFRGTWQEHPKNYDATFLFDRVMDARRELRVIPRFPRQPRLQGISGRHQRDYLSGSQRLKDGVRGALRRVAPWVWL
jgi:hypothetical protein